MMMDKMKHIKLTILVCLVLCAAEHLTWIVENKIPQNVPTIPMHGKRREATQICDIFMMLNDAK